MTATIDNQLVTLSDIKRAAEILSQVAIRTPLLYDDVLSEKLGAEIRYKPECLQRAGAFKFRGAYNYLHSLPEDLRKKGVVAPSSGNHGQGVAMAAKLFGVPATVVMPTNVTAAKRAGAERLGARIVLAGTTTQDRAEKAKEICEADKVWAMDDFRVLVDRHKKCAAERTASEACIGNAK